MTNIETVNVTVTRGFDAPAEQVFDAWLIPEQAGKWLFATPSGEMVRVEINAQMGGLFNFTERRDGEEVMHVGEYLEINRPQRLVFTFAVPKYSALSTHVAVNIVSMRDGCELTLSHEGVLRDWAVQTEAGWRMLLDRLAHLLSVE